MGTFTRDYIMRAVLPVLLLCGLVYGRNVPETDQQELDRGLLGDLLLNLISNMVQEQINNLLGITTTTTTRGTPILDGIGSLLGGETTTTSTTAETTTPTNAGLIEAILSIIFPAPSTTTTTTTTTPTTTTKCGGLIGGGLLC